MDPLMKRLLALAVLGLALFAGVQWWQKRAAQDDKAKAELQAGLAASRVLTSSFEGQTALRVATVHGAITTRGGCTSLHAFTNEQTTTAPFTIAYTVDLAALGPASLRWNAKDHVMFVSVPAVVIEPPNVDMSQARSVQTGMIISRACGLAMQHQVAGQLAATATSEGYRPDYVVRARAAAETAIRNLVRAPLAAANVGNVTVKVRFPTDRGIDDRQWDMSRPIAEVLADPRFRP